MAGMDLQIAEFRALRDAGALGAVSAVGIPGGYVIEIVANNGRRGLLLSRRRVRHFVYLDAIARFLRAEGIVRWTVYGDDWTAPTALTRAIAATDNGGAAPDETTNEE